VEDHTDIAVSGEAPPGEVVSPSALVQWFMYGVIIATICILAGVAIAYLLFHSRAVKLQNSSQRRCEYREQLDSRSMSACSITPF